MNGTCCCPWQGQVLDGDAACSSARLGLCMLEETGLGIRWCPVDLIMSACYRQNFPVRFLFSFKRNKNKKPPRK